MRAAAHNLWIQIKTIPEFILTGFLVGVMIGGISNSIHKQQAVQHQVPDTTNAQNYVNNQLLPQYHITTPPSSITVDPSGAITATWKGANLAALKASGNQFFTNSFKNSVYLQNTTQYNITLWNPASNPWTHGVLGTGSNIEVSATTIGSHQVSSSLWGVSYPAVPVVTTKTVTAFAQVPAISTSTQQTISNYTIIGITATTPKRSS